MIKLETPFGLYYLKQPDRVIGVGALYHGNAKYKVPTRPVMLDSGQTVYISDTVENMIALVGADYVPDTPVKPKAKRKGKVSPSVQESSAE